VRFDDSTTGTPGPTPSDGPTSTRRLSARTWSSRLGATRADAPVPAAERRLCATDQLSLNPADSGSTSQRGRSDGAYPFATSERGGLPEPDGALGGGYQGPVLGSRHLLTGGRGRTRDGRARQPRGGPPDAGAHELRGVRAGPRAPRLARVPDAGGRVERTAATRPPCPAALPCASARATTRPRCGRARAWDQGAELPRVDGESFFAKGNPDLDPSGDDVRLGSSTRSSQPAGPWSPFSTRLPDQIAYTVVDLEHLRGHVREPRPDPAQGWRSRSEARPPACSCSASTPSSTGDRREPSDFEPRVREASRLLRRPRHQGSITRRSSASGAERRATLVRVGERRQRLRRIGLTRAERTPASTRGCACAWRTVEACVVAENLLEVSYQEVLGYPLLGAPAVASACPGGPPLRTRGLRGGSPRGPSPGRDRRPAAPRRLGSTITADRARSWRRCARSLLAR